MEVKGWAYEADCHCNDCATVRFGDAVWNDTRILDREGNEIAPIFSSEYYEYTAYCAECKAMID